MEGQIIEDPVLHQRLRFRRTTDPDGSEVLHVETWIDPGGGVTPHIHPAMEERFSVHSGSVRFLAGRDWRTATAGEEVMVPAGTRHAYRNAGAEVAHMVCEARPPSTLQEFLEEVAGMARAGAFTRHSLPTSPRALLQAAAMVERYRDMAVLLFPPLPPPFLQRVLFPPLARLAARRGLG
jgi:quercetin dioxygenase-like cupin family protein